MTYEDLPCLNTALNALSFCLVTAGIVAVKRGNIRVHKALMLTAVATSTVFLGCYLVYHFAGEPKHYAGAVPAIYYTLLLSHVLLAFVVPFGVVYVIAKALAGDIARHRAVARYVAAIWAYVSMTGVLVYWMVHAGGGA